MKNTKLLAIALFVGLALRQSVFSQPATGLIATNSELYGAMVSNVVRLSTGGSETAAAISNPPASVAVTSNVAVVPVASNTPASLVDSNQTVTTTVSNMPSSPTGSNFGPVVVVTTTIVSNKPSPVSTTASNLAASADSSEAAEAGATNAPVSSETDTNAQPAVAADTSTVTNKIYFQEIPITSVIENLARQAGINFLMDPKIGYGQPDANNVIKAEPSVSIRWENITPEQALIALLDNYGLQLVTDPKTKISKVTIKDPAAPPPLITSVYQLAYADVATMNGAISTVFTDKRSKAVSDIRTGQLIVQATDKEQTDVATLIKKLDRQTRSVLIETRFIEISSNPQTTKGVDWTGTLQAQNITFGNGTFSSVANSVVSTAIQSAGVSQSLSTPGGRTVTLPPGPGTSTTGNNTVNSIATSGGGVAYNTASGFNPAAGFLTANGLSAVMSFINSSSDAQVVSTPRIVTLDNEQATIAVTRAFPIFQTTAGTQGSPGGSSITYSNIGIVLTVTPHISANDYISMHVNPSISSYFDTVTKTIGGFINQADEFDSRNIDTKVLIPNANTLVMGGMVKDSPNAKYTKVPLLGDIPVLGWAFRSENKTMDKQNLLIFITPTIIKDSDFQPTTTDFMNARPIKEKEPLDPNSAWDSGKPRDWSNPKNTDPSQIIINQKSTD